MYTVIKTQGSVLQYTVIKTQGGSVTVHTVIKTQGGSVTVHTVIKTQGSVLQYTLLSRHKVACYSTHCYQDTW